jgi:hypothetical protein
MNLSFSSHELHDAKQAPVVKVKSKTASTRSNLAKGPKSKHTNKNITAFASA